MTMTACGHLAGKLACIHLQEVVGKGGCIWLDADADKDMNNFKMHFCIYKTVIFHIYCWFYSASSPWHRSCPSTYPFISIGVKDRVALHRMP